LQLATFAADGTAPLEQTRMPASTRSIALDYDAGRIDCHVLNK
jgi:hypothetical protein